MSKRLLKQVLKKQAFKARERDYNNNLYDVNNNIYETNNGDNSGGSGGGGGGVSYNSIITPDVKFNSPFYDNFQTFNDRNIEEHVADVIRHDSEEIEFNRHREQLLEQQRQAALLQAQKDLEAQEAAELQAALDRSAFEAEQKRIAELELEQQRQTEIEQQKQAAIIAQQHAEEEKRLAEQRRLDAMSEEQRREHEEQRLAILAVEQEIERKKQEMLAMQLSEAETLAALQEQEQIKLAIEKHKAEEDAKYQAILALTKKKLLAAQRQIEEQQKQKEAARQVMFEQKRLELEKKKTLEEKQQQAENLKRQQEEEALQRQLIEEEKQKQRLIEIAKKDHEEQLKQIKEAQLLEQQKQQLEKEALEVAAKIAQQIKEAEKKEEQEKQELQKQIDEEIKQAEINADLKRQEQKEREKEAKKQEEDEAKRVLLVKEQISNDIKKLNAIKQLQLKAYKEQFKKYEKEKQTRQSQEKKLDKEAKLQLHAQIKEIEIERDNVRQHRHSLFVKEQTKQAQIADEIEKERDVMQKKYDNKHNLSPDDLSMLDQEHEALKKRFDQLTLANSNLNVNIQTADEDYNKRNEDITTLIRQYKLNQEKIKKERVQKTLKEEQQLREPQTLLEKEQAELDEELIKLDKAEEVKKQYRQQKKNELKNQEKAERQFLLNKKKEAEKQLKLQQQQRIDQIKQKEQENQTQLSQTQQKLAQLKFETEEREKREKAIKEQQRELELEVKRLEKLKKQREMIKQNEKLEQLKNEYKTPQQQQFECQLELDDQRQREENVFLELNNICAPYVNLTSQLDILINQTENILINIPNNLTANTYTNLSIDVINKNLTKELYNNILNNIRCLEFQIPSKHLNDQLDRLYSYLNIFLERYINWDLIDPPSDEPLIKPWFTHCLRVFENVINNINMVKEHILITSILKYYFSAKLLTISTNCPLTTKIITDHFILVDPDILTQSVEQLTGRVNMYINQIYEQQQTSRQYNQNTAYFLAAERQQRREQKLVDIYMSSITENNTPSIMFNLPISKMVYFKQHFCNFITKRVSNKPITTTSSELNDYIVGQKTKPLSTSLKLWLGDILNSACGLFDGNKILSPRSLQLLICHILAKHMQCLDNDNNFVLDEIIQSIYNPEDPEVIMFDHYTPHTKQQIIEFILDKILRLTYLDSTQLPCMWFDWVDNYNQQAVKFIGTPRIRDLTELKLYDMTPDLDPRYEKWYDINMQILKTTFSDKCIFLYQWWLIIYKMLNTIDIDLYTDIVHTVKTLSMLKHKLVFKFSDDVFHLTPSLLQNIIFKNVTLHRDIIFKEQLFTNDKLANPLYSHLQMQVKYIYNAPLNLDLTNKPPLEDFKFLSIKNANAIPNLNPPKNDPIPKPRDPNFNPPKPRDPNPNPPKNDFIPKPRDPNPNSPKNDPIPKPRDPNPNPPKNDPIPKPRDPNPNSPKNDPPTSNPSGSGNIPPPPPLPEENNNKKPPPAPPLPDKIPPAKGPPTNPPPSPPKKEEDEDKPKPLKRLSAKEFADSIANQANNISKLFKSNPTKSLCSIDSQGNFVIKKAPERPMIKKKPQSLKDDLFRSMFNRRKKIHNNDDDDDIIERSASSIYNVLTEKEMQFKIQEEAQRKEKDHEWN
nr:ORF88 [Acipenserid herpesvirus 1]